MKKQRKTFISYSRVDEKFALKLAKELKEDGFPVWLDQLDIDTGEMWDNEVEKALEDCDIFLVILTPASSHSENVKNEIAVAIDRGKRILPVLLKDAKIPLLLIRHQYVDFTSKSFEEGVQSAKMLLRKLMEEPTQPRAEVSVTDAATVPPAVGTIGKPAVNRSLPKGLYFGIGIVAVVGIIAFMVGKSFGSLGSQKTPIPPDTPGQVKTPVAAQKTSDLPTERPVSAPTETVQTSSPSPTEPTAEMKDANILVYEDTAGQGLWVEDVLKNKLGYRNAVFVRDRVDDFQKRLTSEDANWDLIIISAEAKALPSGTIWETLKDKLVQGTPIILQTRFVHTQSQGKLQTTLLDGCGVKLQRPKQPSVPIIWYKPEDPIFNEPNHIAALVDYHQKWGGQELDLMQLSPDSQATILAGTSPDKEGKAVIIKCYDGQMILQTFSNLDYTEKQVKALWENYIYALLNK